MSIVFEHEYPHFRYVTYGDSQSCLLRVRVFSNGDLSMFVSDAHDTEAQSSRTTQNIEIIFTTAVGRLLKEGRIPMDRLPLVFGSRNDLMRAIEKRTTLVQCCASQYGEDLSYALVIMPLSSPCWSYMDRDSLSRKDGLDLRFISPTPANIEAATVEQTKFLTELFAGLTAMEHLLPQARSFGVEMRIDPGVRSQMVALLGEPARRLLSNCQLIEQP